MARILAALCLGILLVEASLQAQSCCRLEVLLLRDAIQAQAEVEERLDGYVDVAAVLARHSALRLAVESLMHDALAT